MMKSADALVKLAEMMNTPVELAPPSAKGLFVLNRKQFEAYQKAGHIVEELAKVEDVDEVHKLEPARRPNAWHCYDAVVKCRAIAEEGEGDCK